MGKIPGIRTLEPSAWDYFFSLKRPLWVMVRLRNGTSVAGFYGAKSFASSYPESREIYQESVYRVDENGVFTEPIEGGLGVLIKGEDIHLLEFWDATNDSSGGHHT